MSDRVFLAGATGAIGRLLTPKLVVAGYDVFGTTRRAERAKLITEAGATPVIVDVFDAKALGRALCDVGPQIVIHQLTDLPFGLDPAKMSEGRIRNAKLREVGTKNLIDASIGAGAERIISQSIAWAYQAGNTPYKEEDPLDDTATAVKTLERLTVETPGITGTVLRYGLLYGPGTGSSAPNSKISVHVHDAAEAAVLSVHHKQHGIFNIVEDQSVVSNEKAKLRLHWRPAGLNGEAQQYHHALDANLTGQRTE
jgi:nucleoside-diphosphate-sugar epimerase